MKCDKEQENSELIEYVNTFCKDNQELMESLAKTNVSAFTEKLFKEHDSLFRRLSQ